MKVSFVASRVLLLADIPWLFKAIWRDLFGSKIGNGFRAIPFLVCFVLSISYLALLTGLISSILACIYYFKSYFGIVVRACPGWAARDLKAFSLTIADSRAQSSNLLSIFLSQSFMNTLNCSFRSNYSTKNFMVP